MCHLAENAYRTCAIFKTYNDGKRTGENGLRRGWDAHLVLVTCPLRAWHGTNAYHMGFGCPPKSVRSVSKKFPELLGGRGASRV